MVFQCSLLVVMIYINHVCTLPSVSESIRLCCCKAIGDGFQLADDFLEQLLGGVEHEKHSIEDAETLALSVLVLFVKEENVISTNFNFCKVNPKYNIYTPEEVYKVINPLWRSLIITLLNIAKLILFQVFSEISFQMFEQIMLLKIIKFYLFII